jgi:hypothetical protein
MQGQNRTLGGIKETWGLEEKFSNYNTYHTMGTLYLTLSHAIRQLLSQLQKIEEYCRSLQLTSIIIFLYKSTLTS